MMKNVFLLSILLLTFASFGQINSSDLVSKSEGTSAQFPGGDFELMIFINDNIQFPKTVAEKNINDKCVVRFMVTTEGELKNIEVIKNVPECPECDNEAMRVVKSMPRWKPGKINGKAVNSIFNLKVNF